MISAKVAKSVLSSRSLQALNAATRNTGTAPTTTTEITEPAIRNVIPPDTAPQFDGILFSVPGRGGCDKDRCKSASNPPPRKQEEESSCCECEQRRGCDEHKVTCPPPSRPPQPCHCMKIVSYPPKLKECPGPCPRPKKNDCDR